MASRQSGTRGELSTIELDIIGAGLSVAEQFGIAKLSMSDVARTAGLSRQTLYRYFASKEDLIQAVVEQETGVFILRVIAAVETATSPEAAIELAFSTALRTAQEHHLLQRLLRTEPESLLPTLTSRGGGLLGIIREVIASVSESFRPDLSEVERQVFADVSARLLMSYVITPPAESPEEIAQSLAVLLNAPVNESTS